VSCVIFSGPSLAPSEAERRFPRAHCQRPAACGDIYRAHQAGARSIVLIDGYFEHARSVWHKEILWALLHGTRVYGAASLGALRAVELERFGMLGVGRIFEWFRDAILEDDDEVTLVHENGARNYEAKSEPLVNIRVTLAKAVANELLRYDTAVRLVELQKQRFYALRSYADMLECARNDGQGLDESTLTRWLESERVDQKRSDALAAVERARADLEAPDLQPAVLRCDFEFSYTEAWHEFVRREASARGPQLT